MRTIAIIGAFCVLLGLGTLASQASADVRASQDAFLKYRAETVDALVKQIQSEPAVQARFVKHFRMDAGKLIEYFKKNLVVQNLPSAQKMIVYGCNSRGVIYPRRLTIRKGYPMFCLRDGTPILKARCGNPVSTDLPAVAVAEAPEAPVKETPVKVEEPVKEPEKVEVPAIVPEVAETPPEEITPPVVESVEPIQPVAPETGDQSLLIPPIPSGGGGSPLLFLLPIIPLAGGGGGGGKPPVIPEPSSLAQLALMGTALVSFAFAKARRRRR
jgi:hypothetical protein